MKLRLVFEIALVFVCIHAQDELFISNLDKNCLRCLCHIATGCNRTRGCNKGYCGPYKISRLYWIDGDRVTLPDENPERAGAFENCSNNYYCAQKIVRNYISKFARDCNGDGLTDCEDYTFINFNGGYRCDPSLNRNEAGRNWTKTLTVCKPL